MLSKLRRRVKRRFARWQKSPALVHPHPLWTYYSSFDAEALIKQFTPSNLVASDGVVTNFLGVKMPPEIMPSVLESMTGKVESVPNPGNWHADIAEWAAALLSVSSATGSYQIIELGCGWGCWLNNMGVVASRRGLEISLIGVEGDRTHLEFASRTLELNGLRKKDVRLVHGIAAERNGKAFFPVLSDTTEDWGGEAVFFPPDDQAAQLSMDRNYVELKCFTLGDLSGGKVTDLLHIDIQGAEVRFVKGNIDAMKNNVRRCLVGTHSREIDGAIMELFLKNGWQLEVERPTVHDLVNGQPVTRIDGVQLWRNPML